MKPATPTLSPHLVWRYSAASGIGTFLSLFGFFGIVNLVEPRGLYGLWFALVAGLLGGSTALLVSRLWLGSRWYQRRYQAYQMMKELVAT